MNPILSRIIQTTQIIILLVIATLFGYGFSNYSGNSFYYVLFSLLSISLLITGFSRGAIFFDTFIGIFFFLGFWLKFTISLIFFDGNTDLAAEAFVESKVEFDHVLMVASLAFSGLLAARLVRQHFFFSYQSDSSSSLDGLLELYIRYRPYILILFALTILTVGFINIEYGIYQRGHISQTNLPFGLNGIFKWLLLFGLASFSALLLSFEYHRCARNSYIVALLAICETLISNVSMLSRGMIMNGGGLIYGFFQASKHHRKPLNFRFVLPLLLIFTFSFGGSLFGINHIRSDKFVRANPLHELSDDTPDGPRKSRLSITITQTTQLFLQRWVGIESLIAVSSYNGKSWDLFKTALNEKYQPPKLSFYDRTFINTPYKNMDGSRHHFISLPGIVAFLYYPGVPLFVFFGMFLLGLFAAGFEWLSYKLLGNELILAALIGQVVAYRFLSFGYVPSQSYLLFGALILNILLFYGLNKFFSWLLFKRDFKTGLTNRI